MTDATWTPERFRALQTALGLTNPQMAARLLTSLGAVRKWRLGERKPRPAVARRLRVMEIMNARLTPDNAEAVQDALLVLWREFPEIRHKLKEGFGDPELQLLYDMTNSMMPPIKDDE